MEKFAILHETEKHGQILITKEYDTDTENYKINTQFKLDTEAMTTLSFEIKTEESANEVFEDFKNAETATKLVDRIKNQFSN